MYIIEFFYELFKKEQKLKNKTKSDENSEEEPIGESCEHVFMPIDSTKEILACSKCGFVIKASELKKNNKNFFLH